MFEDSLKTLGKGEGGMGCGKFETVVFKWLKMKIESE